MRCVSRVWREKLDSEDVYGTMLRLHFRGTWEREFVPLDDTSKKAYLENIGTLIPSLCMKRQKRLGGQYHSMACYSFEGSFVQRPGHEIFDTETPEKFQYKNGKLAVQVEDYCIVVNNLRTHVSISCTEEHRRNFAHWILSDSYLVAFVETSKPRLMAWLVDQEADPISIYLESLVKIVSVSGDRVVFSRNPTSIENSSGLSIWHIGHSVQNIGMPSWIASSSFPGFCLGGVVFHPTNQDRLYAFYQPRLKLPAWHYTHLDCSLYVQEYLHNTPQKMWFQDFECSYNSLKSLRCRIQVKAMDCDGLVSIWTPGTGHNLRDNNGELIPRRSCDHDVFSPNGGSLFASFNMFTGEFQSHANHQSDLGRKKPDDTMEWTPLIWRDQILFNSAGYRYIHDLVSLNNCDVRHRRVSANLKKTFPSGLGFGWEAVGAAFVYNDLRPMIGPMNEDICSLGHVLGDDNFLVWACVSGYIVWSFDENVTLCKYQRINF
ncbi:hypothetical protein ACMFMF_004557 [Clarireedia jacksonii]